MAEEVDCAATMAEEVDCIVDLYLVGIIAHDIVMYGNYEVVDGEIQVHTGIFVWSDGSIHSTKEEINR